MIEKQQSQIKLLSLIHLFSLQVLAALDVGLMYFLPSTVFIACYWRILAVIQQRQTKVSHGYTTQSSIASRSVTLQEPPPHVSHQDASTDVTNSANNTASRSISRRQMNVLQTMILITASFIILWMPAGFTIILVYFQVRLFSLNWVKTCALLCT